MFIDKFVRALIKNRILVILLIILIVIAGCASYYFIPKKENPNVAFPAMFITTVYPGASPEEVDTFVTQKIEQKLKETFTNYQYIQSTSMDSASIVVILFDYDVTIDDVSASLKDAIDEVQSDLPSACNESVIENAIVGNTQFIISLSGPNYSYEDLVEYAETIRSGLVEINGVTSIDIVGERTKQVSVKVDPEKLLSYGISIEDILSVMQAQNISIPSGSIDYESGTITVNTPSVFESLNDIENTVIGGSDSSLAFVKVKDVAEVSIEYADTYYYKQDGENAVLLVGYFKDDENAVNIGKDVRNELENIKMNLPDDLIYHEVMYSPEDVDSSIKDFIISMIESVILIVVVVMIGVQLRNGIIISVSIPLSIFVTFIVMYLMDIEFQFISIAALIISLGMLVDNSIVISEAIQQHLNKGEEKTNAIVAAVLETYKPVLTSTLTTFATFCVLYFLPGAIGMVVSTIPTVVIASLTASYLISMFLVPVLAYMFFKPESEKKINKKSPVKNFFLKLLDTGLKHRKITIIAAFSTLIISVLLVIGMGIKFFPGSDKPVIYINIESESSSLTKTSQTVDEIEAYLEQSPLVDNYTSGIGADIPQFFITVPSRATGDNTAQIMIELNEQELKNYSSTEEVTRLMQQELNERISGASVVVKYLEYSIPTDAPVTLYITGDDSTRINEVAAQIVEALKQIDGTNNVRDTSVATEYEYVINLDSDLLSSYGLLKYEVVKQINTSLMGASSASYVSGGSEMDIVVSADINSLDELMSIPITSSVTGNTIQLRQIADVELGVKTPTIKRYNGELYVSVLSNVLPGYSAFSIENELNKYLEDIDLTGITIESQGEFKNMSDLIGNLGYTGTAAILVIFVIIYAQFRSLKKPLIIITSIPLSLIGCCLGLLLFDMDLQAMALLGAVSLFGVVVNNGIVLMEYMEAGVKSGMDVITACKEAINMRYRPIMMTSITTCIGLVPLITAKDPMTAPMASVLLFGLLFSTILTMVVVPVLYASIHKKRGKKDTLPETTESKSK